VRNRNAVLHCIWRGMLPADSIARFSRSVVTTFPSAICPDPECRNWQWLVCNPPK